MSGIGPTFLTGANARIKLAGKTFAYASDLNYQVTVDILPIETMGRYEPASFEPIGYSVNGSFSLVRYTAAAYTMGEASNSNTITGINIAGNGLGAVDNPADGTKLGYHFDPGNLLMSRTFDIDIYMKRQTSAGAGGIVSEDSDRVFSIVDCRFRSMSGGISKRGIYQQQFQFMGVLVVDDSFDTSRSGDIDLA